MTNLWTRRRLMQIALASGASLTGVHHAFAEGEAVSETPVVGRALELRNTHTGEVVNLVYRRGEEYDAAAVAKLRHLLRDHRNGEAYDMDLAIYDQLHDLAAAAGREPRFDIISGYRSPESNAKMAAASSGVAKGSLHVQGRAIDVRLHGFSSAALRDLALAAAKGGVGYYKRSDFVHIDTGRFRTWVG